MAKTVSGVTTRYLVDDLNPTGYAQVVEELSGGGSVQRQYTYGFQQHQPEDNSSAVRGRRSFLLDFEASFKGLSAS